MSERDLSTAASDAIECSVFASVRFIYFSHWWQCLSTCSTDSWH